MQKQELLKQLKRYQPKESFEHILNVSKALLIDYPEEIERLLNFGIQLGQQGLFEKASLWFQTILNVQSDCYSAWHNLGVTYASLNQIDKALDAYRRALNLDNEAVDTYYNMGTIYWFSDQKQEAYQCFNQAIRLNSDFIIIYEKIGQLLLEQEQLESAIASFSKVIARKPLQFSSYYYSGLAYIRQEKFEMAKRYFEEIPETSQYFVEAQHSLADVLHHQKDVNRALNIYLQLVKIEPENALIHGKISDIFYATHNFQQAQNHLEIVLEYEPEHPVALQNLAVILKSKGLIRESLKISRRALSLKTDWRAYSNYLFALQCLPDMTAQEYISECVQWGKAFKSAFPQLELDFSSLKTSDKLRIGYVSPDFRKHASYYMFTSIFKHHDRDRFELICFAEVQNPDEITREYQKLADKWYFTCGMNAKEIADLVIKEKIHILVEMGVGHTANHRLEVFALKPAPIQLSLFHVSLGLSTIDYYTSDPYVITKEESDLAPETPLLMPNSWVGVVPPLEPPEVQPPPCLEKGYITFGSFNHTSKLNQEVIELWSQILHQVPDSKLFLKYRPLQEKAFQIYFLRRFESYGISSDRLILSGWVEAYHHMELYHQLDIGLDPFPFNGNMTTVEALWMGVPVITLVGKFGFARTGYSFLSNANCSEYVVSSKAAYIELAKELASQPEKLKSIRESQRQKLKSAALFDSEGYNRELEQYYQDIYEKWCKE